MNRRTLLTLAAALTAIVLVLLASMFNGNGTAAKNDTAPSVATVVQPITAPQVSTGSAAQPQTDAASYSVSAEQAGTLACAGVPGATLTGTPSLVSFQGVAAYEVPLDVGMAYVDANSGQVLATPSTTTSATVTAPTTSSTEGEGHEDYERNEHLEGGEHHEGGDEGREHD
ncbi:MAG: hypothetical protein HGA19_16575 [Oscillochloris sp.]|nr:hypothetical protein [Oscillochloris sp.]